MSLEVINLDIDFDGTVEWNGSPVANFNQPEGYSRSESRRYPQPEIHLRPDRTWNTTSWRRSLQRLSATG